VIWLLVGVISAGIVLSKVGCDGTATQPTPVAKPTATPGSSTAGGTVGTPTVVEPTPVPGASWNVACAAGGSMTVAYNGEASSAEVETYYTSFDGPQKFGVERKALARGATWPRLFPACHQSDAEPISGRPAGHCYFDKDGVPTTDAKATASCGTKPCTEKWTADEGFETVYGEWGSCQVPAPSFGSTQTQCQKKRTVTRIYYETNGCTKAKRELRRSTEWAYEPCSCPTPPPPIGYCYYEVDCGNQHFGFSANTACSDSTKKSLCEAKSGSWAKWISQSKEHCRIAVPGVSLDNFQLTPGQSHPSCVSKHDD
jgi:hypothetical protein